ncbi:MAG: DNA replication/repair protein RecF [Zymomonas mobilis subsp. pomaceae]|uniref:DNA replication and repair protein RecF n=1 Tax=Zymomonas mobilis subsp. pomaceae (strain ATCC 29192 / DSM 22645 / JCM 10191 / CCUG 17912 / NBRC 13757 / NCIMB 11200 / NRRL B-4491 / Barker I) TaxID=579138 RepID=F8EW02_ZYMMT|nr:DNA replication/repair protein RecF [Zymomonas mobilis]AEI38412.1 DNA replication and repair protein RecF [Zymomonas mobilis subsp. pomaceae ATCC 29192]MDX5948102.1 DNA replication/repair protein RecF [Zymomonas mobilis subsp. pomaceae]GEB90036.1 DNA replication and repair protein RecF [Zymomonas mobilis subsp. pomaceae]
MIISRLSLTNFRSHAHTTVEMGAGLVILTGENGAGKTNILEAISLLSPGRGLRGSALSDLIRREGDGGFAISAHIQSETSALTTEPITIGVGLPTELPQNRRIRINGVPTSANRLSEWLGILWLTPAMDRLLVEGASGRRRFLDRLTLTLFPAHARSYTRYEAAMRQRNRLLADEKGYDPLWLDGLELAMAEPAAAIIEARHRWMTELTEKIATQQSGPFARALLTLQHGLPEEAGLENEGFFENKADLTAYLQKIWQQSRARDATIGRSFYGPHRAEMIVTHHAKNMPASQTSTGEQKALLIGLILAQTALVTEKNGQPPILLLDEVAAHLDPSRREILFDRLRDIGGQVWMSGTESSLFEKAGNTAHYFHLTGQNIITR